MEWRSTDASQCTRQIISKFEQDTALPHKDDRNLLELDEESGTNFIVDSLLVT